MSKIVKAITQPGLGDPLGIHKGGGAKSPEQLKGKKREEYVQLAKQKYGAAAVPQFNKGGTWQQYVKKVESGGFAPPPAPPPAPPAFEFPSFDFSVPSAAKSAAGDIIDKLSGEAEAFADVKAREVVASKAQGFTSRIRGFAGDSARRLAGLEEEDAARPNNSEGRPLLGLSTILGARSRGGQTSTRRKRLSQRY